MKIWIVIVVVGLVNYLSRLSFIAVFSRRGMPAGAARALKYVPAAMLTALVVPMVFATSTPTLPAPLAARVAAAVVAGAVAMRTRSTLWTLLTGMVVLWAVQALLPLLR